MNFFEVTNLSKSYKKKRNALNHVSLQVHRGEIVALIGQNGAGKTTLLNCIAGNIAPTAGEIQYKGENLLKEDSRLNEFGILIQASFFEYLDAFENLVLLMRASGYTDLKEVHKKIEKTLTLVGLSEKKHSFVKSFSFGMKQRLGLAQTLLHDPEFMILDEPFVGLDPIGKEMLKSVIIQKARKEKAGILFSSHDLLDVSEICDRVIMFDAGKKVFDDVFLNKKTYIILLGNELTDTVKNQFHTAFSGRITLADQQISFVESVLLNDILSCLWLNQIQITDIQIRENSLYDYFKKEVAK